MPGPQPALAPSQGYATGTYPTSGTFGYPVSPAATADAARQTPVTISMSPTSKSINTGTFDLVVKGDNFTADSVIRYGGTPQPTYVVDADTLVSPQTSQGKSIAAGQVTVATGGLVSTPSLTFNFTA